MSREQLDNIYSLVKSSEWKEFLRVKEEHAEHLQAEVNRCISNGEYRMADRAQAKLEDNVRDVELLRKRMEQLKSSLPQEEEFTHD